MPTKLQLKLKSNLKTLTQGLLLGGVLTGFAGQSLAAQQAFGDPQHLPVESYAKKMLAAPLQTKNDPDPLKKNNGRSALIILPWEIDDRGETPELDAQGNPTGRTVKVGKGGLVAVRLVDEKATDQTKTLTFEAPQYLRFGDSSSLCQTCEWENDIAVADMNGDGYNDIIALNAFTKTATIFYNDQTGHFDQNSQKEFKAGQSSNGPSGVGSSLGLAARHIDEMGAIWYPHFTDHPFRLIVDNSTNPPSLVIGYLDEHQVSGKPRSIMTAIFNPDKDYFPDGQPVYSKSTAIAFEDPILPYSYGSPYYTKVPKEFYQLLNTGGSVLLRRNDIQAIRWTPSTSNYTIFNDVNGYLGLAHSAKTPLEQPADLLVSRGGGVIHNLVDGSAIAGTEIVNFSGEAFIAGDFDLDGHEDFATVLVTDRETKLLGDLRVGFGDGSKVNAFTTTSQHTRATEAILPWKRNTLQMVAGNFFDNKAKKGGVYQDIAVLGDAVVTVWPNASRDCDLAPVMLDGINPATVSPGDKITLTGNLGLGTRNAITEVTLTAATQLIPITQITTVMAPNTASVQIPLTAPSGDYTVSVKNGCSQSGTVKLTIKPVSAGDASLTGITPKSTLYGKTVTLTGTNLDAANITGVRIEGTRAAAGVVWNATKGGGAGQYQVVNPTRVQLQLPGYLQAKQAGVNLVEGYYTVSVTQAAQQKGMVELTLAADKPIITQLNPRAANLGGTVQINGQALSDVSQIILVNKATMQRNSFSTGAGPGTFSFNGVTNTIAFTLPVVPFAAGAYDVQLLSPKGFSDIDPNFVLTIN